MVEFLQTGLIICLLFLISYIEFIAECDNISDERYRELSKEDKSVYICCLCQGVVPEKMDKYNKKYLK